MSLTVKQIKGRLADLDVEITELQCKQRTTAELIMGAKEKHGKFQATLKNKTAELVVSEHAMLRYLERVWQIDLKEIATLVLPKDNKETIKALGNGRYPINGHKVVIVDNIVVTVTT